jgi:hypothetical protein
VTHSNATPTVMKTADLGEWIEVLTERAAATEGEWTALLLSGDTEGARIRAPERAACGCQCYLGVAEPSGRSAGNVMTGRFSTRMAWNGSGNGHWDVALSQLVNGRSVLLATIPLDEWISLGTTQSRRGSAGGDPRNGRAACSRASPSSPKEVSNGARRPPSAARTAFYRLVDASGDAKAVERAKDSLQGGPSQVRAPA